MQINAPINTWQTVREKKERDEMMKMLARDEVDGSLSILWLDNNVLPPAEAIIGIHLLRSLKRSSMIISKYAVTKSFDWFA